MIALDNLNITEFSKGSIGQIVRGYIIGLEQAERIGKFSIPDKKFMVESFMRDLCKGLPVNP